MRLRLVLAAIGLLAATPAAHASTASFSSGTVTVTAAPGERNVVWVYGELSQQGQISDTAGITAGPGCNAVSSTQVECGPRDDGAGGVTYGNYDTVAADLGDGDDEFYATHTLLGKVDVKGGDGADKLSTGYADVGLLDGGSGDDVLDGADGDDQLSGGAGNDKVDGDDGSDVIDGGTGLDDLKGDGGLGGSNGNDRLLARDGERDTVSCDLGADSVTADALDVVEASSCESIDVPAAAGGGPGAPGGSPAGGALRVVTPNPPRSIRRATLARRGLILKGSASAASLVSAKLIVSKAVARKLRLKRRTLGTATKTFAAGSWSLKVTVAKSARRRLTRVKPFTVVVSGWVKSSGASRPFDRPSG